MPKTTPFYTRTSALNEPQIWEHWAGYLTAPRYQYSEIAEYYSVRNAIGVFDTSPLFKYRITGEDAEPFLMRALARDVRRCKVGRAQYTCWCNESGFVLEDGVVMQVAPSEYWLTAVEPNLRYFRQLVRQMGMNVVIEDISAEFGILAVQGPHSITALRQLSDDIGPLLPFDVVQTTLADIPATVSRTGFTGDLGYEIWVRTKDAVALWDALFEAGSGYNIMPLGEHALKMARIEAGLLLIHVDFENARWSWVDAQRETPIELGWGWMFKRLDKDDRDFIGRAAIEAELSDGTSRWKTVGLEIDYHAYEQVYREIGIMPPKEGVMHEGTMSVYRRHTAEWDYAGYITSFLYSSILKKHIAIAKLPLDLCSPGTEVDVEITPIRKPTIVLAQVVEMPFFDPARRTENFGVGSKE